MNTETPADGAEAFPSDGTPAPENGGVWREVLSFILKVFLLCFIFVGTCAPLGVLFVGFFNSLPDGIGLATFGSLLILCVMCLIKGRKEPRKSHRYALFTVGGLAGGWFDVALFKLLLLSIIKQGVL